MNNPNERALFGTLLASTPPRTRSWRSLFIAVAIHAVLITAAIVTFKPFQPGAQEEPVVPLNLVVVEEDEIAPLPNPFARPVAPPAAATSRARKPEAELTLPRGPLTPITIDPGTPATPSEQTEPTPSAGGEGGRAGGTISERLRPVYIDPRIATTTAFPPAEKTGADAVRARVSDNLTAWNDSIAAEAEARRKDADWTLKGKNGERWGVSEEGLHLGKITIPAKAIAFKPPAGRREEIAARLRDYYEIEKQVLLEESRSSFKDRVELIRARKDRERAEKKKKADDKPITDSR